MDSETKIAQELANKLPQEEVRDYSYPEPEQPETSYVDKLLPEERLTQQQLLDYFQVPVADRHDPIVEDYLQTIYQWAHDAANSGEYHELLRIISEQEQHMGIKLKPQRLYRLAEYVKISRIRQQLAARERALYG